MPLDRDEWTGQARLFMEYLLSPEASKVWVDHFNEAIRPEISPTSGAKSAKDVKTIRPTVDEITKGIPVHRPRMHYLGYSWT
jgi:ABC-type Fe3+ transport system substrate-binding protein